VLAAATFGLRGTSPGMGALLCGLVFLGSALVERPVASGIWCFAVVGALPWTAMYRHRPVDIIGVVVMLACQIEFALRVAPDELTFVIFTVVAAGVSGHLTARRVTLTRRAAQRSARLTTERAVATERAVRAERLTLARDLHDVVSHAVVLMVVQAGAAEALLATRPAAARQSLELVRSTADATLEELDRLLSAMRDDGPNTAAAATEARSLRALVERMRAGGLDVDFDQQGRPDEAPSATVYRIVQETLTNALRHAPRAHVEVRVASRAEETTVEVVDDGPGAGSGAYRGYGLIGMAERVERAGGTIYAGPGYRGSGFRVCATFPALREGAVVT
jgi:signal transduction histidine kinase